MLLTCFLGNEEQIVIDKAPVAVSDDNVYVVWFNDQMYRTTIQKYYLDHLLMAVLHLQIRSI